MKKVLSIILTVIMIFGVSVIAFAAPNNFINSISANDKPEIVEYHMDDEKCDGALCIKAYTEKGELPEEYEGMFEYAYDELVKVPNITDLTSEIEKIAINQGVDPNTLAISDLFFIYVENCHYHGDTSEVPSVATSFNNFDDCKVTYLAYNPVKKVAFRDNDLAAVEEKINNYLIKNMKIEGKNLIADHGNYHAEIKSDALDNFVGLLNYSNDEWSAIDTAKINEKGNLVFSTKKLGAFAIVVHKDAAPEKESQKPLPKTGEDHTLTIVFAVLFVVAVALVVYLALTKKKKNI